MKENLNDVAKALIAKGDVVTAQLLLGQKVTSYRCDEELKNFFSRDPRVEELKRRIRILNGHRRVNVLIRGETGCGKEILAKALHGEELSRFFPVNCAGLSEHLLEAELFGYRQGSFTGAYRDRKGLLAIASDCGGTVFFDEVGEMPKALQPKLLRVLQTRSIRPVGEKDEVPVDCRFIFATHQPPSALRDDLYYRVAQITLDIPSVADRPTDALDWVTKIYSNNVPPGLSRALEEWITAGCLGNWRGLENLIREFQLFSSEVTTL